MGKTTHAWVIGLGLGALGGGLSCDEEDDDNVACYYEQRKTQGCGGGSFGEWEDRCVTIENGKPCTEVATSDTVCEAGCCIQFQVQNRMEVPGTCEEGDPPEGDDDDDDDDDDDSYGGGVTSLDPRMTIEPAVDGV